MPIYEYACTACGEQTEILQKISEPPAKKCPACGKLKLTKQISAAGFRLSGGGWYETDFKKDGKRNLAGDKGESAAASSDKDVKVSKSDKPASAEKKPETAAKTEKTDKPSKKVDVSGSKKAAKTA